ncbi:metallophosphoesterase family protein [Robertmurraya andreesenii]|uniref:Phosphoesterase n=1 Tax=Anoxybacillus andreesenii TaxID=1325932 RepID=A0ABT9V8Q7_9BACL|nr:metallophosphoesterase [Robertmurraya andreesenii]MDQ0157343.1 putative phosphoesterase [Robertmurraya andreesenii]
MAKVLIVSDSHGLRSELEQLRSRYEHEVDLFLHCGDSELSSDDQVLQGFSVVRGNCDFGGAFSNEVTCELAGLRFFVVHGHLHAVKSSLINLSLRAEEVNANVVCFGHTHILGAEMVRGKLFINPGSLLLPRGRREKTYCILDIQDKSIELHVYDFEHGEMMDLRRTFDYNEFG